MATGFPYELKIPNQGVIRRFNDKTQLAKFVETEAGFFQGVSALLAGNVTFANINYGQSNLADQANRMFDGLRRALHGDDLLVQPFDEYVQAAEHLQILVAQGRIGSRVKDALKKEGQQEARWTIQ